MNDTAELVKSWAAELGFDDCRITQAREATHAEAFREWIAEAASPAER